MRRLVFIDDDRTEISAFRKIVNRHYDCTSIHWPHESAKLFSIAAPNIFVSDLYLPPPSGDTVPTAAQRREAAKTANQVADAFSKLYTQRSLNDKARMQQTMAAISEAYRMLQMQWSALGQSPHHGVTLLTRLKAKHGGVPFVFYSRKITPEDVITVLRAGAADAIRKDSLKNEEVLARLETVQQFFGRRDVQKVQSSGFNVNLTLAPIAGRLIC